MTKMSTEINVKKYKNLFVMLTDFDRFITQPSWQIQYWSG